MSQKYTLYNNLKDLTEIMRNNNSTHICVWISVLILFHTNIILFNNKANETQ